VIEALWGRGVIRHTYADWVAERAGEMVWLRRLAKLSPAQRAKIPVEAKKHLGKPYDFWNFHLNDESGFYCTKLTWMAAFRSLTSATRSYKLLAADFRHSQNEQLWNACFWRKAVIRTKVATRSCYGMAWSL